MPKQYTAQDNYKHDILLLQLCSKLENDGWITAPISGVKPLDLIAVKGNKVILGEVKAGRGGLSRREKAIKDAVNNPKSEVIYHVFREGDTVVPLKEECGFYPCHDVKDMDCKFCYCPFYPCRDIRLGKYVGENHRKRWDCSKCTLPHRKDIVEIIQNGEPFKKIKSQYLSLYHKDL